MIEAKEFEPIEGLTTNDLVAVLRCLGIETPSTHKKRLEKLKAAQESDFSGLVSYDLKQIKWPE